MMKSIKYLFTGIFFVLFATSCDKGFEELNQDPNNPTTVPSDLLTADIIRNAANNLHSTFVGGDMGSTWAQLWTKVQYNDEERYVPRQSVIESTWDNIYETVISDARSMEILATGEGNDISKGVALTLQAWGYSLLTDLYGDIPNTEAIRATEGIFAPAYDEQSVVYDSILAKLDRANALIAGGNGSLNSATDLMYGGDVAKWRKFANSLKIRCLMRISGVRDVSADLQATVARPIFTSNADNAAIAYLAAQPNAHPFYETIDYGSRLEWKVSELLVQTLEGFSDPRLEVMAAENADGNYRGKPNGIQDVPSEEFNYENVSGIGEFYLNPELPGMFMSYAELQFLLAEAAASNYISGDPATFYNAGIRASMEENGITSGVDAYLSQSGVSYSAAASAELIGTQKWISLFAQGVEAWTEWRRTGQPALSPAIDAVLSQIPTRYSYPASEQTTNKASYDAAVASQGADVLTTKVWWDN
ncbi:MAG: SusD/RagB family nutrient-binding outer membrane lipoprotein [Marinoscillum sp.]|uniref:SusD/RagB family nutrient-binding outer membrane lipoprotein n=1 Tax=Marinoscillum sp. TaxID=2024838 RepID=UPI0032F7AFC3